MRLNIIVGGKAGQGINKISEIISEIMANLGYFTFNYRDYPSLIRGGHNFNILSISDKKIGSYESKVDGIIAMDENTIKVHKSILKKSGFIISFSDFKQDFGRNLNIALSGALIRILGVDKKILLDEIKKQFNSDESLKAAESGFQSQKNRFSCKKLGNKISLMSGSQAIAQGAINSGLDFYFAYPMTPSTGVLHELGLAQKNKQNKHKVIQPENEISAINMALGCSFTGKITMTGTSGGGFDLMSEAMSMQGISEIPLTIYLASRPGPGTGIPTYSSQGDLDIALRAGHGEAPRIVIAPGDPIECIEKTNEALYLAEKFKTLAIILSDKHLAESQFSSDRMPNKILKIDVKRNLPGKAIVRGSSYEHDKNGHTIESQAIALEGAKRRLKRYEDIKNFMKKSNFQMTKLFGKGKNLVIGWGSNKTVILDSLPDNFRFLQVLYMKPLSDEIKKELEKTEKSGGKVILVESNVTGQLGRLIREKTGIAIRERILKYDTRPFESDILRKQIEGVAGK